MKFIITIFAFILSTITIHEYHIGHTEINYNKDSKTLQINIKLFLDDLHKSISEENDTIIKLNSNGQIEIPKDLIDDYLHKHFKIKVNNKDVNYQYLGREYEDDVIWMYVESKKIRRLKKMTIENTLLNDTFRDQKHFVNVDINGKTKTKILDNRKSYWEVKVKK